MVPTCIGGVVVRIIVRAKATETSALLVVVIGRAEATKTRLAECGHDECSMPCGRGERVG